VTSYLWITGIISWAFFLMGVHALFLMEKDEDETMPKLRKFTIITIAVFWVVMCVSSFYFLANS